MISATTERLSDALADRYRIERELGAGGMATVYLAGDLKHNRRVAINVLEAELAAVCSARPRRASITTSTLHEEPADSRRTDHPERMSVRIPSTGGENP